MSKAKAKKKKDGKSKKDNKPATNGGNNTAEKIKETKIATLTFSTSSLTAQLTEERRNYELLKENSKKVCTEFMNKIANQQEIILFLEKSVGDLKKKCAKYEEQHKSEKKMFKDLKLEKEAMLKQVNTEHTEMINQSNTKINEYKDELKDLVEFKENKIEIENELNCLKNQLEKEQKDRENREAFLERRFLSERERLKKEMLNKIRETKLRLLSMTEDQLHTTTKRTIMENEQMTIELQYQSKETQKLIQKTDAKSKNLKSLKRQIDLHKNTETMLAKRTYFLQKLVDQLQSQIKRMEKEKVSNSERRSEGNVTADCSKRENKSDFVSVVKMESMVRSAEERGFRKFEVKVKKLKSENKMLTKRLVEAQKSLDRFDQQNQKDMNSIYRTHSEKYL